MCLIANKCTDALVTVVFALCPQVLKRPEYFGRFGKIHKVVINNSTSYAGSQVRGCDVIDRFIHLFSVSMFLHWHF